MQDDLAFCIENEKRGSRITMTHFDWRQRIGKAGERRVEQFVEETLKLAYRKVGDPDIGVDGMIEFADHDEVSSGGLLAVQVKATEESLNRTGFTGDRLV
ncbi:DUF4365 domain-containing protein [Agrobacterium sp. 22-209-1]